MFGLMGPRRCIEGSLAIGRDWTAMAMALHVRNKHYSFSDD
jgi:hypothetical protein